jgi:hypothetical protein
MNAAQGTMMFTAKISSGRHEVVSDRFQKAEILSGWKDVANYLGKGVRTVQRYERELTLPIRRPRGTASGTVIATKAELDAWVTARPIRDALPLPSPAADSVIVLRELRQQLAELRRLRRESAELREDHHKALQLLRENLRCCLPEQG